MGIIQSYILYYSIIVVTTTLVLFSEKLKKLRLYPLFKILFWISLIFPVLVSGFRYGIGTDYFNYVDIYHRLSHNGIVENFLNSRYEPGWIVLNYIVKIVFDDVMYLFLISSLLIWLFNFKAIYENKDKISISVAVLILLCTLYNPSFNGIRQFLAASILMLSIKPILDRKFLKFLFTIMFATSFHFTSLIFLPTYWIVNSKTEHLSFMKKTGTIIGSIALVIFAPTLLSFVTSFDMFSTYSHYDLDFSGFGVGNIILKLPIILLILLNLRKLKSVNPIYKIVIFYFIGLILEYYGYYAKYIERIAIYYDMMQIFILSAIIKIQTNKYEKLFYTFIIIIYFIAWFTYNFIILNRHQTIPYMLI